MEIEKKKYDYDLIVIGGGSGGIACAREAKKFGKKIAVCDFVKPSPIGTKWGLGGTCVNVGCIPKKFLHQTAILGELKKDMKGSGWEFDDSKFKHNWKTMITKIDDFIKGLNEGYESALKNSDITYFNKLASFVNDHTIELKDGKNPSEFVTSEKFVIAVGARPSFPEELEKCKELCITSDDLFYMPEAPGKTLVIGASFVALVKYFYHNLNHKECGGVLTGLGMDTTVMVRSILLRGFDQQMANKIGDYMESRGTKFIRECTPLSVEKLNDGKRLVTYCNVKDKSKIFKDTFDSVLVATGRRADTKGLNLNQIGVLVSKTGRIIANEFDQSKVPHIYAIGDCAEDRPEHAPPAIHAGKLLARRLFGNSTEIMDYLNMGQCVFTPIEYGCFGYSEEEAIQKYYYRKLKIQNKRFGENKIDIFHCHFTPLEWVMEDEKSNENAQIKVITLKENKKVIGFHQLGPNAGEITMGFAVAVRLGLTKDDLDSTIGIHPTCAEEFVRLTKTKVDDPIAKKTQC